MSDNDKNLSMDSDKNDSQFVSFNDLSMLSDVSRSVDQLCTQMSMVSVKIVPLNTYSDVGDFITEFELVTTGLSDDQKVALLAKAFPPGRYRSWYETDLKPILSSACSWRTAKRMILDRFSETELRDRHVTKLKELKFDPDGDQSLLEFVDDMAYSYMKALPDSKDQETLIRLIKASIPHETKATLNVYHEFRDAKCVDSLKKAAKQFDIARTKPRKPKSSDVNAIQDLTKAIQSLVVGVKKDTETTRDAIVAAVNSQFDRQNRERSRERYRRADSPRQSRYRQDHLQKNDDNNYRRQASQSPYGRNRSKTPPRSESPKVDAANRSKEQSMAFDSHKYWELHKKPPSPCVNCGLWHWIRHCPQSLN